MGVVSAMAEVVHMNPRQVCAVHKAKLGHRASGPGDHDTALCCAPRCEYTVDRSARHRNGCKGAEVD